MAVDADHTAYIVWNGPETGNPPHYCRLPAGAAVCAPALTLTPPPNTGTTAQPVIQVAGTRVTIIVYRDGIPGLYRYSSSDGGQTFGPADPAGGNVPIYDYAFGPGDTVSIVTSAVTAGGLYTNVPLGGGTASGSADIGAGRLYTSAIGLMPNGLPLAIFEDASSNGAFRMVLGGDPNVAGNWSAPVDLGRADYPHLAGGPAGLFMIGGDGSRGLFARKFDGTGFGSPTTFATGVEVAQTGLFQDAGGRLHAVYPVLDASGYHATYASSDDGTSWSTAELDVQTAAEQDGMRVATAADHVGTAVWSLSNTQVQVAPVGPVPQFHKSVVVGPVSGTIRVRAPGKSKFTVLTADTVVPLKSTVDSKHGVLELSSVPSKKAAPQTLRLSKGQFKVTQSGKITDFALNEPLASCGAHAAAKKKPKSRQLFGSGKGSFRTTGTYSAATIRGTRWSVKDTCAGTLTRVFQGTVQVRDTVRKRTVLVRAGKRYLARPRRR